MNLLARLILLALLGLAACAPPAPVPAVPPAASPARTDNPATRTPAAPSPTAPDPVSTPTLDPETRAMLTQRLIQAAEAGDTPLVLQLLREGALRDGQDDRGRTAVLAATHGNHPDTVRALIRAGADINQRDHRLDNVLLYSSAEGLLDIVNLAIEAGADTRLTNRFGGTALIPAAERGHVEIVEALLTRTRVDVNHVNNLGWTALLEAVILGEGGERHQRIVQLLVEHGANVNLPDANGVTALAHARARGFAEIERLLTATPAP